MNHTLVRAYLGQERLDTVDQVLAENRLYGDMAGPGCYLSDVPCAMCFYQGYGLHGV